MRNKPTGVVARWTRMLTAGGALLATAVLGFSSVPRRPPPTNTNGPAPVTTSSERPAAAPTLVASFDRDGQVGRPTLHVLETPMVIEINLPRHKTRLNRRPH